MSQQLRNRRISVGSELRQSPGRTAHVNGLLRSSPATKAATHCEREWSWSRSQCRRQTLEEFYQSWHYHLWLLFDGAQSVCGTVAHVKAGIFKALDQD